MGHHLRSDPADISVGHFVWNGDFKTVETVESDYSQPMSPNKSIILLVQLSSYAVLRSVVRFSTAFKVAL